jgi:hypothetical protein
MGGERCLNLLRQRGPVDAVLEGYCWSGRSRRSRLSSTRLTHNPTSSTLDRRALSSVSGSVVCAQPWTLGFSRSVTECLGLSA